MQPPALPRGELPGEHCRCETRQVGRIERSPRPIDPARGREGQDRGREHDPRRCLGSKRTNRSSHEAHECQERESGQDDVGPRFVAEVPAGGPCEQPLHQHRERDAMLVHLSPERARRELATTRVDHEGDQAPLILPGNVARVPRDEERDRQRRDARGNDRDRRGDPSEAERVDRTRRTTTRGHRQ